MPADMIFEDEAVLQHLDDSSGQQPAAGGG